MGVFLITGYPRSRTAWLANFLTYGSSFCFHEPVVHTPIEQFQFLFDRTHTKHAGVSDSGALLYFDQFIDIFPDAKIVLVKRDRTDVIRSMVRLGFDFSTVIDTFTRTIEKIEKRHEVLTVPFGALPAAEIWEHCVPGEPVNQMRLQMLNDFRVQLLDETLHKNVAEGLAKVKRGERLY